MRTDTDFKAPSVISTDPISQSIGVDTNFPVNRPPKRWDLPPDIHELLCQFVMQPPHTVHGGLGVRLVLLHYNPHEVVAVVAFGLPVKGSSTDMGSRENTRSTDSILYEHRSLPISIMSMDNSVNFTMIGCFMTSSGIFMWISFMANDGLAPMVFLRTSK